LLAAPQYLLKEKASAAEQVWKGFIDFCAAQKSMKLQIYQF
jgi:hypothetical protein